MRQHTQRGHRLAASIRRHARDLRGRLADARDAFLHGPETAAAPAPAATPAPAPTPSPRFVPEPVRLDRPQIIGDALTADLLDDPDFDLDLAGPDGLDDLDEIDLVGVPVPSLRGVAPTTRRDDGSVKRLPTFHIEGDVLGRFYAYAEAAFPHEIGGMLQVIREGATTFRAIDLCVFPQRVTHTTFDLDELAVARFMGTLAVSGRGDEVAEWSSLIHSHPRMTPFLSGRDQDNIERLAQEGFAWSLICSINPNEGHWQRVHYHQASPVPMTLLGITPIVSGSTKLDEAERAEIRAEARALCSGDAEAWNAVLARVAEAA